MQHVPLHETGCFSSFTSSLITTTSFLIDGSVFFTQHEPWQFSGCFCSLIGSVFLNGFGFEEEFFAFLNPLTPSTTKICPSCLALIFCLWFWPNSWSIILSNSLFFFFKSLILWNSFHCIGFTYFANYILLVICNIKILPILLKI